MWALAVIVLAPLFDDDFGLLECVEDFAVKQLVPEAGVEALAVAVLPRRTWGNVGSLGSHSADPVPNLFCDELWAVVGTDESWRPPQDEEVGQGIHHVDRVQLPVNTDRQRLPCELIDDIQRAVDPPVIRPVMDEVIGPDMIGALWPEADAGPIIQPQPALLWLLLRYFKPLTPPDPLHTLMVHMPAGLVQQSCHTTIAVTAIGASQFNDVCCQAGFV